MVFSSIIFLCVFMPIVFITYFLCPAGLRNILLLVASLVFYAWGEPVYILVMLFSTFFNYLSGRLVYMFKNRLMPKQAKTVLVISIIESIAVLFLFKYTDFFIQMVNMFSIKEIPLIGIALPAGISFYTFQIMSYTIDVYRGRVEAQKNIIDFAMYVCMFPQLIAGPVVRYEQVAADIHGRKLEWQNIALGFQRFVTGLGKKVIFANMTGALWEDIYNASAADISVLLAWLGAVAYTFQIYFDFSGYSDMAIGLGHMFGFTLPENFGHPYSSKSITEFWRRWHITLGAWFREYVYIPLGGNHKGRQRQIANLFVVWFLTGLWHGASWNFVLWGMYFFVILLAEKLFLLKEMERWPEILQHFYAVFFITVGWVLFSIEDFSKMGFYLQVMFGMKNPFFNETAIYYLQTYGIFLAVLAVASSRLPIRLVYKLRRHMLRVETEFAIKKGKKAEFIVYSMYTLLILLVSIGLLISGSYNPFLYFRF